MYHTIIIGAGAAGLAAAQTLLQSGEKNILVLEARDRIGGRVWSTKSAGTPVELGASWIHRIHNNPIADIAKKIKTPLIQTLYSTHFPFRKFLSMVIYNSKGDKIPKKEMRAAVRDAKLFYVDLRNKKVKIYPNDSFQAVFNRYLAKKKFGKPRIQLLRFVMGGIIESDTGADLSDTGLISAASIHSLMSGYDALPQKPYIHLLKTLSKNIPILLNEVVKTIQYNKNGAVVSTQNGVFCAKKVICTLPLGVLKSNHVKFKPALPESTQKAIRHLAMNHFNKIYLHFDQAFWPKKTEWLSFMASYRSQDEFEVLNYYRYTQLPILLFFTRGHFAKEMESWSDEAIIQSVMMKLKKAYGNKIPQPTSYTITRWGKDPYALGSYSYPKLGSSIADYHALAKPIKNTLFLAGEAMCDTDPCTVHGAYLSGVSAAKQIIG